MAFAYLRKRQPTVTALVIFTCAIIGLPFSNADTRSRIPDCLNSNPNEKPFDLPSHPDCQDDKAGLAKSREVIETEKLLGLGSGDITFIGCPAAPFSTRMADLDPPFHFKILYTFDINFASTDYIAPILHEIGHVYQLKKAGSLRKLLEAPIERVELGADFLAGFAAARLGIKNPSLFERTLSLVGSYEAKSDFHGRPEDRTKSFRYGFFYRPTESGVDSSYADFQDNLFSQITRE